MVRYLKKARYVINMLNGESSCTVKAIFNSDSELLKVW